MPKALEFNGSRLFLLRDAVNAARDAADADPMSRGNYRVTFEQLDLRFSIESDIPFEATVWNLQPGSPRVQVRADAIAGFLPALEAELANEERAFADACRVTKQVAGLVDRIISEVLTPAENGASTQPRAVREARLLAIGLVKAALAGARREADRLEDSARTAS